MSTQNCSYGKPGELVIGAPGRAALNEDTVERNWELENYVRNASLERAYSDIQSAEAFNLRVSDVKNELQQVIPRPLTGFISRHSELKSPDLFPPTLVQVVDSLNNVLNWGQVPVILSLLSGISAGMCGRYRYQPTEQWHEAPGLYFIFSTPLGVGEDWMTSYLVLPFIDFADVRSAQYVQECSVQAAMIPLYKNYERNLYKTISRDCIKAAYTFEGSIDIEKLKDTATRFQAQLSEIRHLARQTAPARPNPLTNQLTSKWWTRSLVEQGGTLTAISADSSIFINMLNDPKPHRDLIRKSYWMRSIALDAEKYRSDSIPTPTANLLFFTRQEDAYKFYTKKNYCEERLTSLFIPYFITLPPHGYDGTQEHAGDIPRDYYDIVSRLLKTNYTQELNKHIKTIPFTEGSLKLLGWFEENLRGLMAYPFVEDFIYHLPSKAVRLAGAIHAWMYDEPERYPVDHYTTQAAIELAESTIPHAAFALAPSGLSSYHNAAAIVNWLDSLEDRPDYVNVSRLSRDVCGITPANVAAAVNMLEQHGYLRVINTYKFRRRCVINPRLYSHNYIK